MRRKSPLVLSIATVSIVVTGCAGSASEAGKQGRLATNGTFTFAVSTDPTFDPYHSATGWPYHRLAYDSLLNLRPDGTIVSGLAGTWTAGPDSATFRLRPEITCSDGTALTASQVAAAINYVSNPKNQSPLYGALTPTVPVTASGDNSSGTVKVILSKPYGFLLNTIGRLPIVCARGLQNPKVLKTSSDGTGPFVMTQAVPGQRYTFKARDGYKWGPGGASADAPGTPTTVVMRIVQNSATRANLLLTGEVNFASVGTDDATKRFAGRGLEKIERKENGAWLWFNHLTKRPTADLGVRRALVQALDLGEIVKVSTGGVGSPATGLISAEPKVCPGDNVTGQLPQHDANAAEKILDESGWTKGQDGTREKNGKPLTLDLHFRADDLYPSLDKAAAELIARRWNAIGAKVKLTTDTVNGLTQVMTKTGNFDVYLQRFGGQFPGQIKAYLSGPTPPTGANWAAIHNKNYEELTDKAEPMLPPQACAIWDNAERALYRDIDIVPVATMPEFWYLQNSTAKLAGEWVAPTSIRVYA